MTSSARNTAWAETEYALIDFGEGRKLERFGGVVLDRPCPAADDADRLLPEAWECADLVVHSSGKIVRGEPPGNHWQAQFCNLRFQLTVTPFGHVGLFPEQAENWRWLVDSLDGKNFRQLAANAHAAMDADLQPASALPSALNLFGYTGATTLVLASAGCRVVHVNAAAPSVAWARKNAELNRLSDAPIRWIVDDARKFVEREVKRRKQYDIIVLDPPSYGHGPRGKSWELDRDLPGLLHQCARLLAEKESIVLVSCHTHGVTPDAIFRELHGGTSTARNWTWESRRLTQRDANGRALDFGMVVRGELGFRPVG